MPISSACMLRSAWFASLLAGAALVPPAPVAVLTGFARLPADTFAAGPPSGAFIPNGRRVDPSFPAQPVQGLSSLCPVPGDRNGWWYALADNGFGSKLNSPDFLLRIYRVRPRWRAPDGGGDGGVEVAAAFIQLSDPSRHLRFHLVHEDAPDRRLTGADLDPESLVAAPDGTFWIGEEFGPFLVHVDANGRVLEAPFEAPGLRSPDSPWAPAPDAGAASQATTPRSRGFEGLAISSDGTTLYAAQESTALDAPATRVFVFDVARRAFTGRTFRYEFARAGHTLTEFVSFGSGFLAIERDNAHGPAARFKQVFEVSVPEQGEVLTRRAVIDLLDLADPDGLAGRPGTFTFPFITTEAIWPLDERTLVLVNDNNFPATGGRREGVRDDTEFIRVRLPD